MEAVKAKPSILVARVLVDHFHVLQAVPAGLDLGQAHGFCGLGEALEGQRPARHRR